MQELAGNVLVISKESNDSSKVALTCDLGKPDPLHDFGAALETEHDVDVLSDALPNHMIVSSKSAICYLKEYTRIKEKLSKFGSVHGNINFSGGVQ